MSKGMSKHELEAALNEWKEKVLSSYDGTGVSTYSMIEDVDKIIAEAFDHSPVIQPDFEPSIRFFND